MRRLVSWGAACLVLADGGRHTTYASEVDVIEAVAYHSEDQCGRLPSSCTPQNKYCASFLEGMDLLVPSYEKELCKLELLGRSIERHDVCRLMRDVHIPWVSQNSLHAYTDDLRRVQTMFGPRYSVIFHEPRAQALSAGWFEQQLVKLYAHAYVKTKWYLILDSKNIFVHDITLRTLFGHHRASLQEVHNMTRLPWYAGAADAMNVDISEPRLVKPTLTPALFNTDRVRSLFAWLDENRLSLIRLVKSRKLTEFTLYEIFSCCNPWRWGEPDPWRDMPLEEAVSAPYFNYMVWTAYVSLEDLYARIDDLQNVTSNETAFKEILVLGWQHALPINNESAILARSVLSMYSRGDVIRNASEECAFYTRCAGGVVAC